MCGILTGVNIDNPSFEKGLSNIGHRGPDSQDFFQFENTLLGHVRLSIQDLSENGKQPMTSNSGDYTIVFNGEIYNHWKLRENLSSYDFKSTSDTETLLALFEKEGVSCLNKLRGIFAFSILNHRTKKLIVVRDQYGVKPLYYYMVNNRFICSSELKGILPGLENNDLDKKALKNYLTYMWSADERTPFKTVKKLLPGHYIELCIDSFEMKLEEYYVLKVSEPITRYLENDLIEQLDEKLSNAVNSQLISDAPIGFFLSGGLDSSLLVALAKKARPNERLVCYTIDSGPSRDGFARDLDYAIKVAEHLDVDLRIVKVDSNMFKDFDNLIWHLDEPQADPAPLNLSLIAQQARKDGIKVLIGGTGGDDIFSGYRRHQVIYYEKYFKLIPSILVKSLKSIVNKTNSTSAVVRRLRKFLKDSDKTTEERYLGLFEWNSESDVNQLFQEKKSVIDYASNSYFKKLWDNCNVGDSVLNKMLFLEVYTFLVGHNLNYTDKLGMAHGVEIRVPFLDIDLVDFAFRLPPSVKMKGKETKYILKKMAEKYIPKDVIYRPKSGFGAPVDSWIRNELKEEVNRRLSEEKLSKSAIFDYTVVQKMIDDNADGKVNKSYAILSLMAIDSWLNQYSK